MSPQEAVFAIAWLQQLDLRLPSAGHLLEQAPDEGTCGEYKQGGGEQESELQVLLGCGWHWHGPIRSGITSQLEWDAHSTVHSFECVYTATRADAPGCSREGEQPATHILAKLHPFKRDPAHQLWISV